MFALAAVPVLFAQTPDARAKILSEKITAEKMAADRGLAFTTVDDVRTMTFDFMTTEAIGGRTIKNAPYSAEAVTETVQTLGDGNRIVNRNSSTLFRDSEGRERREQILDNIGGLKADAPVKMVSIWDPVAKTSYSLDESKRTARKSSATAFSFAGPGGGASAGARVVMGPEGVVTHDIRGPEISILPAMPRASAGGGQMTVYESRSITRTGPAVPDHVKTEDLGERMIEGVKAKGSRTTRTIPTGEIGNERPIEVVSERWYSEELQTVVMTKRSDPRMGETTYKLMNVNRSEPQRTLFEVPSDYTVIDNLPTKMMMRSPAIRERKPEELF